MYSYLHEIILQMNVNFKLLFVTRSECGLKQMYVNLLLFIVD